MKNPLIFLCDSRIKGVLFCVFSALAVLVMVVIFCFSAQNAFISQSTSDGVLALVTNAIEGWLSSISPKLAETVLIIMTSSFRKLAHFCIYTLLGFFVSGAVFCIRLKKPRLYKSGIAFIICALYAVTDEIHQSFIPGRSCELRDVIIDSSGALLGTLFMLVFYAIFSYIFKSKNKLS